MDRAQEVGKRNVEWHKNKKARPIKVWPFFVFLNFDNSSDNAEIFHISNSLSFKFFAEA